MKSNYNYKTEILISLRYSLDSFYKETKIAKRTIFYSNSNYVYLIDLCFMSNSSRSINELQRKRKAFFNKGSDTVMEKTQSVEKENIIF